MYIYTLGTFAPTHSQSTPTQTKVRDIRMYAQVGHLIWQSKVQEPTLGNFLPSYLGEVTEVQ